MAAACGLAMALAGYAQIMHPLIFYASWGALVLMYWEPYLAPQSPAASASAFKDGFNALLSLKLNSSAIDAEELAAIKQYVLGIQRGLSETQLRVYKVMVGAVIVPYCCLVVGVVKQVSLPAYSCEQQVVYSSCGLLGLMTVYTVSVGVCLWVIKCVQQQESEESRAHEVDWQPRDMMFFMCKILGESVNTVVQTLIAGSFTPFMTWRVFWLSISITGLSYTATNLLYGFEGRPPTQDAPPDRWWLIRALKPTSKPQHQSPGRCVTMPSTTHGPTATATQLPTAFSSPPAYLVNDDDDDDDDGPGGVAAPPGKQRVRNSEHVADSFSEINAGNACQGAKEESKDNTLSPSPFLQSFSARLLSLKLGKQPEKPPSPPFLVYKWPKGLRGWSIIGLLLAVAVPSVLLLGLVGRGIATGTSDHFFQDEKNECQGKPCEDRYKQLLLILGCLGCLISYYAFTIGFLGAGPVTWLYRVTCVNNNKQAAPPQQQQQHMLLCRGSSG